MFHFSASQLHFLPADPSPGQNPRTADPGHNLVIPAPAKNLIPVGYCTGHILFRLEEIKLDENLITVAKEVYYPKVILLINTETVQTI